MESSSSRHNAYSRSRGSWRDVLAFTVGLVGGLVSMFAIAGPLPRRRRRVPGLMHGSALARRVGAFPELRRVIFGHSKREVARVLGPPPAASPGAVDVTGGFWQADTWYYPLDPYRHTAVAVQFDNDRVTRIDHIAGLI